MVGRKCLLGCGRNPETWLCVFGGSQENSKAFHFGHNENKFGNQCNTVDRTVVHEEKAQRYTTILFQKDHPQHVSNDISKGCALDHTSPISKQIITFGHDG